MPIKLSFIHKQYPCSVMFVCVECGVSVDYLCEQISPSVLKLAQCEACGGVIGRLQRVWRGCR